MSKLHEVILPTTPLPMQRTFTRENRQIEEVGQRYLYGGPGNWHTSLFERDASFYEAQQARTDLAAAEAGGNPLTWWTNLVSRIVGSDSSVLSGDQAEFEDAMLEQNGPISFGAALNPVTQSKLPKYKMHTDVMFSFDDRYAQWKEENKDLDQILRQSGVYLEEMKDNIRNETMFRYAVNFNLTMNKVGQQIDNRNRQVRGLFQAWESSAGFFRNNIINDPTFAPSLFVGGAGSLAAAGAMQGGKIMTGLGKTIGAAHRGIAMQSSYGMAALIEGGVIGGTYSALGQMDINKQLNVLFEGTQYEREFSVDEMMLSSGIGAALGVGLTGAIGGGTSWWQGNGFRKGASSALFDRHTRNQQLRQAAVGSANGDMKAPIIKTGFTPDGMRLQSKHYDEVRVRLNQKMERLAPSTADSTNDLAWVLDETILSEAGLDPVRMEMWVDELSDIMGDKPFSRPTLNAVLQDIYHSAKTYRVATGLSDLVQGPVKTRYEVYKLESELEIMRTAGGKTGREFTPGTVEFARRADRMARRKLEAFYDATIADQLKEKSLSHALNWAANRTLDEMASHMARHTTKAEKGADLSIEEMFHLENLKTLADGEDSRFQLMEVPISWFTNPSSKWTKINVDDFVSEKDLMEAIAMAKLPKETAPPGVAGTLRNQSHVPTYQVLDGKHRIRAAIERGDETVLMYVDVILYNQLRAAGHARPGVGAKESVKSRFNTLMVESRTRPLTIDEEAEILALEVNLLEAGEYLSESYVPRPDSPIPTFEFTLKEWVPTTKAGKIAKELMEIRPQISDITDKVRLIRKLTPPKAWQLWKKLGFESPNFKKWWKVSKVTTPDNKPMRMYHGTFASDDQGESFVVFNTSPSSREPGTHFGTQASTVSFVSHNAEMSRVYPVYLSIQNPLRVRDPGSWTSRMFIEDLYNAGVLPDMNDRSMAELVKAIQNAGYDGLVYINRHEGTGLPNKKAIGRSGTAGAMNDTDEQFKVYYPDAQDSYAIFHPWQAKSALGNPGTFDAKSGKIIDENTVFDFNPEHLPGLVKERNNLHQKALRREADLLTEMEPELPGLVSFNDLVRKYTISPPQTSEERVAATMEFLDIDSNSGALVTDIHLVAQLMGTLGMGGMVADLITQKTGQMATTRSALAAIRVAADMLDDSRFKMEAVRGNEVMEVGTFRSAQRDAERPILPLVDYISQLWSAKYFPSEAAFKAWQREFVFAAHGLKDSAKPEINHAVSLWRKAAEEFATEGTKNGRLRGAVEKFFPQRILPGKVRANATKFANKLTQFWTNDWLKSNKLHGDTLVRMGWADRVEDGNGGVSWIGKDELFGVADPLSRKGLTPEQLVKYTDALTGLVDDKGDTAIASSAWRATNRMLSEDTYEITAGGNMKTDKASPALSDFERVLPAELLLDPEMAEFFDFSILDVMFDYVRTTGFEIKAQSLAQARVGNAIPGLTVDELYQALRLKAIQMARQGTEDFHTINVGFGILQQKLNHMRGRAPRLIAQTEKVGEYMADMAVAGTLAFHGSFIGPTIAVAEGQVSSLSRFYDLRELGDNIFQSLKTLIDMKHEGREVMEGLTATVKIIRHANAERFTSGNIESGFHFRLRDKISVPWQDTWATLSGKTKPGVKFTSRLARGSIQAVEAVGKNMLTIFGSDFWSNFARIMQVYTLKRETARFLPAARKLAERLEAEKPATALLRQEVMQAALDNGDEMAVAIQKANKAEHQKWVKLARESGFGRHWQVARRFAEAKLMNVEMLDVLIAAGQANGSIRSKGLAFMSLTELAQNLPNMPKRQRDILDDGIRKLQNSIEKTLERRLSEQGPLQIPTDANSRTALGRTMNTFTGFARTFADNNVLGLAEIPQSNGMAMLTGFMIGEIMSQMARRLLRGESLDDLQSEWDDNPHATAVAYMLRVPFLGQYTPILQTAAEAALMGSRRGSVGGSAGTAVQGQMMNLALDGLAAPGQAAQGEDVRVFSGMDKMSQRIIPGYGMFRSALGSNTLSQNSDRLRRARKQIRDMEYHELYQSHAAPLPVGKADQPDEPNPDIIYRGKG